MAGCKTKLTPEIQKTICDHLRDGCYAVTACAQAGISESTYYLWLQKGETGRRPYSEFSESVKKAEADAEVRLAGIVMRVGLAPDNPNWQAAMTFLERRFPQRWGRRMQLAGDKENPIKVETTTTASFEGWSEEEVNQYAELCDRVRARRGAESPGPGNRSN
jgi:hypothetical protein